jgi:imidazolonepropionase-like amidohydrolase
MSGGVASPYDPLDSLQFSDGEVSAAVEEATAFGRYVCAHAYSAEAITRAARLGVRTIEHGNLIDDASAKAMAEKGMYLVANLVTYYAMKQRAAQWGMIGESLAKNEIVLQGGLKSLEICKRGKVGTLQPGAFADLILVDGNPLNDLALLGDQGKHLSLIMKAGVLHKNRLN